MKKGIPTVNIHEAKTHLSRLVDQAAKGEPFIIAKAGKPLVKVSALDAPSPAQVRRFDFMAGQIVIPDVSTRCTAQRSKRCFTVTSETVARYPPDCLGRGKDSTKVPKGRLNLAQDVSPG
jgi:prevent-host-death family protein